MSEYVTVACKLPAGLQICKFEKVNAVEGSPMGQHSVQKWERIAGTEFKINGYGKLLHADPEMRDVINGKFPGGFAITPNVPADTWNQFVEFGHSALDAGLVFAVPTYEDAEKESKSRRELRCGLEAIDPAKPELTTGRTPEFQNPMGKVSKVEPGKKE